MDVDSFFSLGEVIWYLNYYYFFIPCICIYQVSTGSKYMLAVVLLIMLLYFCPF